MSGNERPPTVALQARLPTSETISIEAVASEEMKKVKERIASMGGLDVDIFTLTFDGEVVAAASDDGGGQLVGDLPFEDGSMLEVVVCKRQAALLKLSEMGIEVKGRDLFEVIDERQGRNREGVCEVVNLLLDAGVSGREEESLHRAARCNLPSCVEVLLTRTSVDVNSKVSLPDDWRSTCTALHRATSEEVAAVLLRHNADVNARDSDGVPVIHEAACGKQPGGKLSVLLRYNADVNARDREGKTALHGRFGPHPSAVRLLLEHGTDIETRDDRGRTPLFLAGLEVAEALLDHGADVKARDNRGNTCLHHPVERGLFEVLPVLLRHNADVTARNDEGETALDRVYSDNRDRLRATVLYGGDVFKAVRHLLEDPSLAHDLELFENGRELSDVNRLPVVQLISREIGKRRSR